jgi:DNA gyrase inhibitor GyrI
MEKEIHIDMIISNCDDETQDTIWEKFIEWVEANGWSAGGTIQEVTEV